MDTTELEDGTFVIVDTDDDTDNPFDSYADEDMVFDTFARHRNKEGHGKDGLVGKVWYKREIDEERLAANIKKMRVEDALNHLTSPDEIKRQAALEVLKGNQ